MLNYQAVRVLYNLATLCLNGTLPGADSMCVTMGDVARHGVSFNVR